MRTAKLIIVGFGNIGKGTAEVLLDKRREIVDKYGLDLRVSAICEAFGCLVNAEGIDLSTALEYAKGGRIREHPDWKEGMKSIDAIKNVPAEIVLELTPGDIKTGEPGLSHIKAALSAGRHVVTSNKSPIALRFKELQSLAKEKGLKINYEATVGGAVPILNLYRKNIQVNTVKSIYGILNGTCNFILDKMFNENLPLETALKEAQELGIAETDPSYDIEGIDTAAKLVILANSIMGDDVSMKDLRITGIKGVTPEAIELAKKRGYTIKLIADVNERTVSPRLVPLNHPLNVSGTLNAIMLDCDIAGMLTVVGHGAGRIETASSIISDVMDILSLDGV